MTRLRAMLGHILLTSLGVVVGGVLIVILKGGFSYLPHLDGLAFPIVRSIAPTDEIVRTKERACFTLHLRKIAPGVPIKSQFFVAASLRDAALAPAAPAETWLAATKIDAVPVNREWKNRAVGEPWLQRWCFDIPATISDGQAMQITGYAVHSRRPFFDTETPLPTFVIPSAR